LARRTDAHASLWNGRPSSLDAAQASRYRAIEQSMRPFDDSPSEHGDARPAGGDASPRELKRARILGGAVELISRFGLEKTTVEDIAQKAGLKPASVYYYFSSKEEVFAAVIRHYAEAFDARVRRAVGEAATAEAKLAAFLLTRFSYLDLVAQVAKPAAVEAYPAADEVVREFRGRERALVEQIFALGVERGEFEIADVPRLAAGLSAALAAVDRSFVVEGLPAPAEDLHGLLAVFLRGLRKG
jgi:AcrR family transcriptional regulator